MVLSLGTSSRRQISGLMCRRATRSWYTTGAEDSGILPSWPLSPPTGSLPWFCPLSDFIAYFNRTMASHSSGPTSASRCMPDRTWSGLTDAGLY